MLSGTSCRTSMSGVARGLDRMPRRRVVPRRGQPQRAIAAAERNDRLHRSFAERSRANDGGEWSILNAGTASTVFPLIPVRGGRMRKTSLIFLGALIGVVATLSFTQ